MRFVALAVIIFSVPIFFVLLQQNARYRRYLYFAVGFLPFVISAWNLDGAIISWATWPGQIAFPFTAIFIAYIGAAALSIVFSNNPQASFFYAWQLGTVMLVFWASANICMTADGPKMIIAGLICGITLQAGFSINQKLSGVVQASGTMGHQNLLGVATHFALYPSLALLMATKKAKLPVLGVIAGLIVVAFGASRATIGLAGIGVMLLIFLSMVRKPSARKTKVAVIGLVILAAATPVAISSLQQRFAINSTEGSNEERQAFERAAKMIWSDHPMGIGANQYVVIANTEGYSQRAGVIWNQGSRSAPVHNSYLLVAAETGFIGLFCFILLIFVPIIAALKFAWANRGDPRGDLAVGIGVTLTVFALHSFYEWVMLTWVIQYLLAIAIGMLAGLMMQRKAMKRAAVIAKRKKQQETGGNGVPALVKST
ncbi:O-antigen ligase family protein [Parasphingorhabdus cellanae]|uniref:O-antigen ligase family protein n=1 Tax=Parasphingorhabdus cellanae TaxID=2806553 RepID=A0ABX7T3W1_9SPHN|nr:O-antigen ligase family protein [Parasphingorhabdus cellanae]QTD56258.1 O-antigen ligase family protein [Parasphingorhabdus cellanae]